MPRPQSFKTPVASAARTTSGNSGVQNIAKAERLTIGLFVTAASGSTPTLDVSVEWTFDGTTWLVGEPADAFTQITTTKNVVKTFDVKAPRYRLVWAIAGGTPSFTFSYVEFDDKQD